MTVGHVPPGKVADCLYASPVFELTFPPKTVCGLPPAAGSGNGISCPLTVCLFKGIGFPFGSLGIYTTSGPPLTSSLTAYVFSNSSIPFEKNQHSPKQWFHCLKFYHLFSVFTTKICFLITVFQYFRHLILCLVFQHSVNDTD